MKTILLIDDDGQLRTMFALALRRNGYHVIEADSGQTGLVLARQHLPDLILTDIHMPGGDGTTLLHDIRRDPELKSKQVVLMTGRPDLITPRKGMEDGADDFLEKPVGVKALVSCVEARFRRATINWRVEDRMLADLGSTLPPNLPHEFFTPLAGIIGLMELLMSGGPMSPTELQDIHGDVYLSAQRLHRTLRNYLLLLELTNTPAAPQPPLAPGDLENAIRTGIDEALRTNKRKTDVAVKLASCSIPIRGDDLTRVVEELIDNACKFSRQGTPVAIDLSADGRLTVTDQGRGMTPEQIGRIGAFHQFERKKNEQQGLGLGLTLVQKLIAPCPAALSLQSEPGKGTTATIAFPVAG